MPDTLSAQASARTARSSALTVNSGATFRSPPAATTGTLEATIFGSTVMIAKVLGTVAVGALAGLGAAAPASAHPPSFSETSCSCQPTLPQLIPLLQAVQPVPDNP